VTNIYKALKQKKLRNRESRLWLIVWSREWKNIYNKLESSNVVINDINYLADSTSQSHMWLNDWPYDKVEHQLLSSLW